MKIQTEEGIFDTEIERLYAENFIKENKIKAVAFILELEPNKNIKTIGENERFKQICFEYFSCNGKVLIRPIFLTDKMLNSNFKNIKNRDYVKDDGYTFEKGIVLKISNIEQYIKNAYWYCNHYYDSISDFFCEPEDSKIRKIEWNEFIKSENYDYGKSESSKPSKLIDFEKKDFMNSVFNFIKNNNGNVCSFLDENMFNLINDPKYSPEKHLWTYNIYGKTKENNMNDLSDINSCEGQEMFGISDSPGCWEKLAIADDLRYLSKKDASVSCTLDSFKYKETKQSNNNSFMENLKNKIKSQFIPEKVNGFKLSVDGVICIKSKDVEEEYVGINNDNELITYPSSMCIDFPMYVMSKSYSDIKVGDIIDTGSCFAKVLKKNGNNSLSCLTFNGTNKNSKTATDFLLKQPLVKVLINLFDVNNSISGGQNNNLALALIFSDEKSVGEGDNFAKMMMYSQLANGNSNKSNSINPFMLSLLLNKDGNKMDSFQDIIMASAISGNGNNIFGNLLGQNNVSDDEPKKDVESELEELKKNYEELLKEVKKEKKETKTTKK